MKTLFPIDLNYLPYFEQLLEQYEFRGKGYHKRSYQSKTDDKKGFTEFHEGSSRILIGVLSFAGEDKQAVSLQVPVYIMQRLCQIHDQTENVEE
jgi:hypothetical protein